MDLTYRKMRYLGITVISLALTAAVIGNAYYQKKQFYPSVVYITKSNPSMAVMYVQALILVVLMGKLMRKVFFGQLRAAEFEHLVERSWYAVTETCLAFTVFRDDFSPKFVALFTVLLFLKSFHWLAEDRVDFMERSPVISALFHIRVLSLFTLLGALDLAFVAHAYQATITKGASVQLVFGFEYAILFTIVVNIAIKYVLHTIDLNSENPWDNKAVFLLYTELIMGFVKVILYVAFVAIMVRIYTLPLFAFRPMYYTMRSFKKAFHDVIMSRRAIQNMNTLYPDATPEELAAADNVCIICREEMISASKKLPCNHIFHTACLRSWFQRQQTCPTCRLNVLRNPLPGAQNDMQEPPLQQPAAGMAQPIPQIPANGFPPFFAGMFPFGQPFQQPPAQQPPQPGAEQQPPQPSRSGETAAGTSMRGSIGTNAGVGPVPTIPPGTPLLFPVPPNMTPPSTSSGSAPSTIGMGVPMPQFFYPPFPLLPFTNPAPIPSVDYTTLTMEELEAMEKSTREGVEARIKCLKNIQLMLDASVLLMQQYSMSVNSTTSSLSPDQVSHVEPVIAAAAAETVNNLTNKGSKETKDIKTDSHFIDNTEGAVGFTPPPTYNYMDEPTSASSLGEEHEEIRRRRLQKFATQNHATD